MIAMKNQSSANSSAMNDSISSIIDQLIVHRKANREYMTDLNYSQGFYVTDSGSALLGGIRPINQISDSQRYLKAEMAARFAVEEENKKRGQKDSLKFIKIININYEPSAGAIYYVTFAAEEYLSGEVKHFQTKIWEKLHTGYQVQIFRVAPYCAERIGTEDCCILIDNLQPGMDENYLFYKCFFKYIHQQLFGVKIFRNEETGMGNGELWFSSGEAANEVLEKYDGKKMPHSNQLYKLAMAPKF